jgi:hypothetical protein
MFFEADLHLQLHIKFETPRRSLHRLELSADVRIEAQPKLHPLHPLHLLDLALYLYPYPYPYPSLVFARAFDIERVTVSSSPCIGGDDELLVTHIELTHRRGCKIHGGDEVGWASM